MDNATIWFIIGVLAIGTYAIRFSFLGFIGDRDLPEWVLRHLRYVGVGVLPALVAPLVLWPAATGGETDLARLLAAVAVFGLGMWRKNPLLSTFGGFAVLYAGLALGL